MWPPSALSRETRSLADFLCSAHHAGCRVKSLKGLGPHTRLRTLWRGGFVVTGTFIPTPEAFDYWRKRRDKLNSAPVAQELEVPPTPKAAKSGGGGAARKRKASPPKQPGRHAPGEERVGAAEVPNEPRPPSVDLKINSARPTGTELAQRLEAWCAKTGASKARLSLYLFGSLNGVRVQHDVRRPVQATIDKVNAFLDDPLPPDRLPVRPKAKVRAPYYNQVPVERDGVKAARFAQKMRRGFRKKAEAALDAGLTPTQASPNAGVRGAMREIAANREAMRRAADPVEQAKKLIRQRGFNCFDAFVLDGERKGKGHFYIGQRRVNETELLAYADELAAKCR